MKKKIALSAVVFLVCSALAMAEDPGSFKEGTKRGISLPNIAVTLRDGPGKEVTGSLCGICHSLDYITTQPKFPRARWQAEVNKMIKVLGAPISPENADVITNYITKYYGTNN
jgi:sulfite dehydrogenase (cytochrome) subunit B